MRVTLAKGARDAPLWPQHALGARVKPDRSQRPPRQTGAAKPAAATPPPAAARAAVADSRWYAAPFGRDSSLLGWDGRGMCRAGHSCVLASDASWRGLVVFGGSRLATREQTRTKDSHETREWHGGVLGSTPAEEWEDQPRSGARVPGGSAREFLDDVHVLDCSDMSWDHPRVSGQPPAPRHLHSAVWVGVTGERQSGAESPPGSSSDDDDGDGARRGRATQALGSLNHALAARRMARRARGEQLTRANHQGRGGRMVVFGGEGAGGHYFGDVFVLQQGYDNGDAARPWRWSEADTIPCVPRPPCPASRCGHAAVLAAHPDGRVAMYVFGGKIAVGQGGGRKQQQRSAEPASDLWRLDLSALLWAEGSAAAVWERVDCKPANAPSPRWGHSMIAMAPAGRGGASRAELGEAHVSSGLWPPRPDFPRAQCLMTTLIVSGGRTSDLQPFMDLFALDLELATWSALDLYARSTESAVPRPLARHALSVTLVHAPHRLRSSTAAAGMEAHVLDEAPYHCLPLLVFFGGRYNRRKPADAAQQHTVAAAPSPSAPPLLSSRERAKAKAFGSACAQGRKVASRGRAPRRPATSSELLRATSISHAMDQLGEIVGECDAVHVFCLTTLSWLDARYRPPLAMQPTAAEELCGTPLQQTPPAAYGHTACVDGARVIVFGGRSVYAKDASLVQREDHCSYHPSGLQQWRSSTWRSSTMTQENGLPYILDLERTWVTAGKAAAPRRVEDWVAARRAQACTARKTVAKWAKSARERRAARRQRRHEAEMAAARLRIERRRETAERASMAREEILSDLLRPPLKSELGPEPILRHTTTPGSLCIEWCSAEGRGGVSRYKQGRVVKCWLDGTYDVQYRVVAPGRRFSAELAVTLSAEDAFRAAVQQNVSQDKAKRTVDEIAEAELASLGAASAKIVSAVQQSAHDDGAGAPALAAGGGGRAPEPRMATARNVPRSLLRRPREHYLGSAFGGIIGPPVPSQASPCGWEWSPLSEGDLVELRVLEANLLAAKREQDSDARYRYTKQSSKLSAAIEAEVATVEAEAYKHTVYALRMSKPGHDIDSCPICRLGPTLAASQRAHEPVAPLSAEKEVDEEEADAALRQAEIARREARHAGREAHRELAAMQKDEILRHSQLHFDVIAIGGMREMVVSSLVPEHVVAEERRRRAGFHRAAINHTQGGEHRGTLAKLSANSGEEQINLVTASSWRGELESREPTPLFQEKVHRLLRQQEQQDREALLAGERVGGSAVLTPAGTVLCLRGLRGLRGLRRTAGEDRAEKDMNPFEFGTTPVAEALSQHQGTGADSGGVRRAFHVCAFDVDRDYASFPGPTVVFAPPPITAASPLQADDPEQQGALAGREPLLRARFESEIVNARTEMIT